MFGTYRLLLQVFVQFFNCFSCLLDFLFGEGVVFVEGELSVNILKQIHDAHGLFSFVGGFLVMGWKFRLLLVVILSDGRFGWSP